MEKTKDKTKRRHRNDKKYPAAWKTLITAGCIMGALVLIVLGYAVYLLADYKRLPDHLELEVRTVPGAARDGSGGDGGIAEDTGGKSGVKILSAGGEYRIMTYNIGFGAYTPDYSFFMDGGKYSWAESEESVLAAVSGAGSLARGCDPDFVLFEEVDLDGTRSYHVDQLQLLDQFFPGYFCVFALNYDSSFLFWPPWQPHGSNKAGIALYSAYPVESAVRRSFPVSDSLNKFFDLDRCYSVTRVPVDNGKYLCIFALHMSAYGNSDAIRKAQVEMLCDDMEREYAAGNYVICGGDFNHDLKAEEASAGDCESWAYPFPRSSLPDGLSFAMDRLPGGQPKQELHDSARNADMPYEEGVTYTVTLDGFILSDNVECTYYENIDKGYLYSDHDPVFMHFILK